MTLYERLRLAKVQRHKHVMLDAEDVDLAMACISYLDDVKQRLHPELLAEDRLTNIKVNALQSRLGCPNKMRRFLNEGPEV